MKKIIILLVIFSFIFGFSQNQFHYKDNHFPIKYVLKNSKDTISTRVQNIGIFSNKKFSPATYLINLNVIDSLGNKTKMSETDIDYMEITDLQNVKRKFTSSNKLHLTKDFGVIEIMYKGKISWYRDYFYEGFVTHKMNKSDFFIDEKDGKLTGESGFFTPGIKNNLKEKLKAYPDLVALIDKSRKDEDLLKVLDLYDKK